MSQYLHKFIDDSSGDCYISLASHWLHPEDCEQLIREIVSLLRRFGMVDLQLTEPIVLGKQPQFLSESWKPPKALSPKDKRPPMSKGRFSI